MRDNIHLEAFRDDDDPRRQPTTNTAWVALILVCLLVAGAIGIYFR